MYFAVQTAQINTAVCPCIKENKQTHMNKIRQKRRESGREKEGADRKDRNQENNGLKSVNFRWECKQPRNDKSVR